MRKGNLVIQNGPSDDPSRPDFSYEAMHLRPEMARVFCSALISGDAERLAGITAAYEVDRWNSVMVKSPC